MPPKKTLCCILIGCFAILGTACDCMVNHQGFVMNERTHQPITNATIHFGDKAYSTDSAGFFDIHYLTNSCPDEQYRITKKGYKTFELSVDRSAEEVSYTVREDNDTSQNGWGYGGANQNSNTFKVRNDTLYFYLEEQHAASNH